MKTTKRELEKSKESKESEIVATYEKNQSDVIESIKREKSLYTLMKWVARERGFTVTFHPNKNSAVIKLTTPIYGIFKITVPYFDDLHTPIDRNILINLEKRV